MKFLSPSGGSLALRKNAAQQHDEHNDDTTQSDDPSLFPNLPTRRPVHELIEVYIEQCTHKSLHNTQNLQTQSILNHLKD